MIIVLDSNVIISAFITTSGTAKDVFLYCGERHRLVISRYIIAEVAEKLQHKLGFSSAEANEVTYFLETHFDSVEPAGEIAGFSRDPEDNPVIGLALSARADFLISGDKDLLVLKKIKGVKIISPAEFWRESRS